MAFTKVYILSQFILDSMPQRRSPCEGVRKLNINKIIDISFPDFSLALSLAYFIANKFLLSKLKQVHIDSCWGKCDSFVQVIFSLVFNDGSTNF